MAITKKVCAYEKCDLEFYGSKRAKYCPNGKCGHYQRRLDAKQKALESQEPKTNITKG